jgi:non-canonical (house-cleaning) NTP pyrophosphatase
MTAVDHRAAHACVDFTANIIQRVIDGVAGQTDVRSRQGAWGVLSKGLLTRAMSFETALVAAFAPFYNARLYE